jgi:hypothetical protein
MDEEKPDWLKKAVGAFETIKGKIAPKEQEIEPNYGRNNPHVLNEIHEKMRRAVIHVTELGKLKAETEELTAYVVILSGDFPFNKLISLETFVLFLNSSGTSKYALRKERKEITNAEKIGKLLVDELNWAFAEFKDYKEFATQNPWKRYSLQQFNEFKAKKVIKK